MWAVAAAAAAAVALAAWQWRQRPRHGGRTAIVVCGGGLTASGAPAAWVVPRLQRALGVYSELARAGPRPLLVTTSAGTTHKPS